MSLFSYNSSHKIIVSIAILSAVALHTILNRPGQPTYENGQVKQSGSVVNGHNHGVWTWYHPNGHRKMQGRFERGERTGLWVTFAPDGDTLTTGFYRNDRLNGDYTVYAPGDQKVHVTHYVEDKPVSSAVLEQH
ncbi:MAG: hypothetical protein IPH05_14685 [Flavobacteriales bacterium]|nr:hypothetical protein [Flavobacteriales bacterium]